jgi:Zn-finger nucleic acid-binding protein
MSKRIVYDCDKCSVQPDEPVKFYIQTGDDEAVEVHLCPKCAGQCLDDFVNEVLDDFDKAKKWLKTYAPLGEY